MQLEGKRKSTNVINLEAIDERIRELTQKVVSGNAVTADIEELKKLERFQLNMGRKTFQPPFQPPQDEETIRGRWLDFLAGGGISEIPQNVPVPTPRPSYAAGGLVSMTPDSALGSPLLNPYAAAYEQNMRNLLRSTETSPQRPSLMDEMRMGIGSFGE